MQFFIEVDLVHYTAITPITLCLWQVLRILFGKAFDIFGGKNVQYCIFKIYPGAV